MPQNLKFILDIDNDDHYTDSLIPLRAERYIWYRLRRDHHVGDMIFLHEDVNHQLKLRACDGASAEQLGNLAKKKVKVSPGSDVTLESLKPDKKELLEKLCDLDEPVALVFSYDAFVQVCRGANQNGKTKLMELLRSGTDADRCIYVRLPSRAEALEKTLRADVSGCEVLQNAFEEFGTVCTREAMSMVDALEACMGERFLRLDRCEGDMERLLLSMSLDGPDSLKELQDQAEYLELCRMLRVGILEPKHDVDRFTPVSVAKVRQMLQDPSFRDDLRNKVQELRSYNPDGSIQTALGREEPLPELPPFPMHEDELTRQVMSLSLRKNRFYQITWGEELDKIKRSMTILWGTPRNPSAVKLAKELCEKTAANISKQTWEAVDICLKLLEFFAEQICVSEAYSEALEEVGKLGKFWVDLQEEVCYRYNHGKRDGLGRVVSTGLDKVKETKLKLMQELVENDICDFKPAEIPADVVRRKLEENFVVYQREIEECERLQEKVRENHNAQEQDVLLDMEHEDISDLMDDEDESDAVRARSFLEEIPEAYDEVEPMEIADRLTEYTQAPGRGIIGFTDANSVENDLD